LLIRPADWNPYGWKQSAISGTESEDPLPAETEMTFDRRYEAYFDTRDKA
jgi:hypothetical protein